MGHVDDSVSYVSTEEMADRIMSWYRPEYWQIHERALRLSGLDPDGDDWATPDYELEDGEAPDLWELAEDFS